jgi:hypothetical protein
MIRIAMTTMVIAAAVLLAACGDDDQVGDQGDLVGGPCTDSGDCQFRCEEGDHYPDGVCTVACNIDEDCPAGTWCINREEGICLLACEEPADCRSGYSCKGEENRGTGGDSLVCIHD